MLPVIYAGIVLAVIVGVSIYARKKGQSGFGVFFLLYSTVSILVHFVMADASIKYDFMRVLPQIGVIVSAGGVIYAQAKGKKKIIYALPGLIIIGIAIFLNMPANGTQVETMVNATNQTSGQ